MYEVIFNTCGNETILRRSGIRPEYREQFCRETRERIASGPPPQYGYFSTKSKAEAAIRDWYGAERKRLLALVRYCRKMERKHSKPSGQKKGT